MPFSANALSLLKSMWIEEVGASDSKSFLAVPLSDRNSERKTALSVTS
jgi:hypothetical protein